MRCKLADMYNEIEAGRGLLYARLRHGRSVSDPLLAAQAKVYCNEMSIRVTGEAVQILAATVSPTSSLCRALPRRALRQPGRGTSETLRDLIGKRLMARPDLTDGILGFSNF
jgi:alkylation response protein AidB-like acyl-CoA dehydrogenase